MTRDQRFSELPVKSSDPESMPKKKFVPKRKTAFQRKLERIKSRSAALVEKKKR
jgi:hypothetical protein